MTNSGSRGCDDETHVKSHDEDMKNHHDAAVVLGGGRRLYFASAERQRDSHSNLIFGKTCFWDSPTLPPYAFGEELLDPRQGRDEEVSVDDGRSGTITSSNQWICHGDEYQREQVDICKVRLQPSILSFELFLLQSGITNFRCDDSSSLDRQQQQQADEEDQEQQQNTKHHQAAAPTDALVPFDEYRKEKESIGIVMTQGGNIHSPGMNFDGGDCVDELAAPPPAARDVTFPLPAAGQIPPELESPSLLIPQF